jgi:hypothetical protein
LINKLPLQRKNHSKKSILNVEEDSSTQLLLDYHL